MTFSNNKLINSGSKTRLFKQKDEKVKTVKLTIYGREDEIEDILSTIFEAVGKFRC